MDPEAAAGPASSVSVCTAEVSPTLVVRSAARFYPITRPAFSPGNLHLTRSAIATVGYDVTDPNHSRESFTYGVCISYCDSTLAECQAAALALEQVVLRIGYGRISPETVTLFVDAESVEVSIKQRQKGLPVRPAGGDVYLQAIEDKRQQLSLHGSPLEAVSREYNSLPSQRRRRARLAPLPGGAVADGLSPLLVLRTA